jgi:hypothetical protein
MLASARLVFFLDKLEFQIIDSYSEKGVVFFTMLHTLKHKVYG